MNRVRITAAIFVFWLVMGMLAAAPFSLAKATSLSDLAVDQLDGLKPRWGGSDPFRASARNDDVDLPNLVLEGVVIGHESKLALISGQILHIGDSIGRFTVTDIAPSFILLASGSETNQINLEGYSKPLKKKTAQNYSIHFRNADLRDALNLLAKAAGYNLISPEDVHGQVNVSFEDSLLRDAMGAILKVNNYSYALESGIVRVGRPDQFSGGTDLLATTIALRYATSKDLVDKIKPLLSEKGSVTADDRSNVLSVKDYDANIETVRRLIAAVDKKDQQVLIEAHIVDATTDFSRTLAIQGGASGTPGQVSFSGADSTGKFAVGSNTAAGAIANLGAPGATSGLGVRFGRLSGGTNIDLQLTAAEQKGEIRIISKPTVSTINNMPARIRSGVKLHVKSTSNITVGTEAGTGSGTQSGLQVIETGVQLNVTPQISSEQQIKLVIETTESEADFSRTVDGIPAILDNTASTTVLLKNGETAVIGGLIKTKDSSLKKSVPGISQIPLFGNLFKSKAKSNATSELIIFITPRILK